MKIIYFIPIFFILIIASCSNSLVVGTLWLGEIKINNIDYDLEIYFKQSSITKLYAVGDFNVDGIDEAAFGSGTYNITTKNEFSGVYSDFNILGVEYNLKLTGILNYSDGSGYGDYKIKSAGVTVFEDEWKISKLNNY